MNLERLTKIREQRGLTQQEMAQKLKYKSKASYCLIEKGKARITIDLAVNIKKILNLDEDEFRQIFFEEKVPETQTYKDIEQTA